MPVRFQTQQLQLIADRLGIHVRTVFRVLNGSTKGMRSDNAARSQEIRRLAEKIGYRPSRVARSVRAGRQRTVALVFSRDLQHGFIHGGSMGGILDVLEKHDLTLCVVRLTDAEIVEVTRPAFLRESMCDGFIVNHHSAVAPSLDKELEQADLPMVWLNVRHRSDAVHLDDRGGAALATRHLLELGHRRIAYVGVNAGPHHSIKDRLAGYRQAMADAHLPPEEMMAPAAVPQGERAAYFSSMLSRAKRPTAIVTYQAADACALVLAARSRGLIIAQDLSIIAINDRLLDDIGIAITVVAADTFALGRSAADMLLQRLADPSAHVRSRALAYVLMPGATCGPPA